MRALFYLGAGRIELQNADEPRAREGQSIVDISYCGICGSDMHAYHGHDERRVPPLILGHEVSGVVRSGQLTGTRVAVNPLMTCGSCPACSSGAEHLCPTRELIGMRVPGGFAECVAINNKNLIAIPDSLSLEQAALAEPLACTVHAVDIGLKRLIVAPRDAKIIVLGGGAIGLLCALVFAVRGVTNLSIAETNPLRRRALADVLPPSLNARPYDPTSGEPASQSADIILDAVGSGATRKAASALAAPGGSIVHIGLQNNDAGLDTRRLTLQEIAFIGTYCYRNEDFAEALRLLASKAIRPDGWAETRPLAEGAASFRDIDAGNAPAKIILKM